MHQFIKDIQTLILDTLFPIECLVCKTPDAFMCALCLNSFKKLKTQHCMECGKPAPLGFTHPSCKATTSADALLSIYDYHDKNIGTTIIAGKYKFIPSIYIVFGHVLADWIDGQKLTTYLKDFIIAPLPLAPRRQRWRGFNQAEILARKIGTELGIPYLDILTKTKSTKTQKDLKRADRFKNTTDAFSVITKTRDPWYQFLFENNKKVHTSVPDIQGKNILLIDDVVTTGATLREATKTLKRGGVNKVWCLTIARD